MAAYLEQQHGIASELVMGSKGIFRVEADGEQLFDKWEAGRWPEEEEIGEKIAALLDHGKSAPDS